MYEGPLVQRRVPVSHRERTRAYVSVNSFCSHIFHVGKKKTVFFFLLVVIRNPMELFTVIDKLHLWWRWWRVCEITVD